VVLGRDAIALAASGFEHFECDVADEASVTQVFDKIGPVDILVNNAGVSTSAPLHRTTLDDWNHAFAVNATGAFLCTRAVLPVMRVAGWGRIVTVASIASHRGSPYIAAYVASKHAVLGLMRVVAAEAAGSGVTANSICPGYVRSEMTDRTIANIVNRTGRSEAEAEQALVEGSSLGRLIEPNEVAAAVAYLCSAEAAAVNGQSVILDGGTIQQ
jgi:NAD(P)-dependent dehydrogenase (short-subunit alcohol dehydrogenase family)